MKRNVGFIIGVILLMVVVWGLTILGRNVLSKKENNSLPSLAIERILC